MTEEEKTGAPQDGDGMGGTPPAQPQDGEQPQEAKVPDFVKDPVAAYAEIQRLRKEAAENRTKASKLETDAKDRAEKALAEQGQFKEIAEQRQKEIDRLVAERQDFILKNAILAEAAKAGVADPGDVYRLLDLAKLTIRDDGTVDGVTEAVASLVEAKPYLVKSSQPPAEPSKPKAPPVGATNPAGSGASGPPAWIVDKFRPGAAGPTIGDGGVLISGSLEKE